MTGIAQSPPKKKVDWFYVAMRIDPTKGAQASCVIWCPETVEEFFRDYTDREIRFVSGDEMKRLMTTP